MVINLYLLGFLIASANMASVRLQLTVKSKDVIVST